MWPDYPRERPVYARRVDPSVLAFSLSLHRHPHVCISFNFHFICRSMFVLKKFECRRDVNGGSPESDPAPDVGKDWLSAGGKNKSKGLSEGHVEVSCNLSVYTTEDNDSDMSQVTYQSVGHDGGFTCDLAASPRLLKPQGLPRFTFKSLLPSLQPGNRPSTPIGYFGWKGLRGFEIWWIWREWRGGGSCHP